MNPKQTVPLLVTLAPAIAAAAPPLLIGCGVLLLLKWLSEDDKEKQPEIVPADKAESPRKVPESLIFSHIPAESAAKPAAAPRPAMPRVVVLPPALPSEAKPTAPVLVPAAVIVPKIVAQAPPPPPIKKKVVTREDMATVFERGTRALTRTAAVAGLKKLGFGKTAAYAALTPDGRFALWLQIAPDGIITWTGGHKA
jgi:hypothetical protein